MRISHLTLGAFAAVLMAVSVHAAAPIKVTNTDDAGPGSLRDAMDQANATPGSDKIVFNIPGAGPHVIRPQTNLPPITEAVDINGSSQDGIVLDGEERDPPLGFAAIVLLSDGSTVKGLEIRGFTRGVGIVGVGGASSSGNTVQNNHVHNNDKTGVDLRGFGTGVSISDNTVKDNYIHNNGGLGVAVQVDPGATASGNTVKDNHIHDNWGGGMVLGAFDFPAPPASGGALVSGNTVKNNRIHNNGNEVNGLGGILLNAADFFDNGINPTVSDNTVKDNEIHGNARHGIWLSALVANNGKATISNNTIKGNDIESSTGWGVEILGNPGLPPFFVDGTVVDNTFRSNTFAGNGLGEIHWPAAAKVTALLRSTTWGVIKTQRPRVIAPVESDMGNVEDLLNRYGLDQLGR